MFTAAGSGFDADPRQPAVGDPEAELQGVLLEHRPALPHVRQAGGAGRADRAISSRSADRGATGSTTRRGSRRSSNLVKYAGDPVRRPRGRRQDRFGSRRPARTSSSTHAGATERAERRGYADPEHPFRHQGSADINTYKLFLEQAHALLRRGRPPRDSSCPPASTPTRARRDAAQAVAGPLPLGVALRLREPRQGLRHRPPLQVLPGHRRRRAARPRRSARPSCAATWRTGSGGGPRHRLRSRAGRRLQPARRAILEIRSSATWRSWRRSTRTPCCSATTARGWGIKYATEFHMTNDSKLFPPRPTWEERGYRPDEYGRWLRGNWQTRTAHCPAPRCPALGRPRGRGSVARRPLVDR